MNRIISNTKKALRLSFVTALFITGSLITRAAGNELRDEHHNDLRNDLRTAFRSERHNERLNEPNESHPGSASTAEVKYIGSNAGDPLFNVVYNNATGARFSLKVMDEQGSLIFQSFYTGKKFDKKFQVANAQDYGKLVFVIKNMEDGSVQRFEVDSNTRLIEDVEVKEVR